MTHTVASYIHGLQAALECYRRMNAAPSKHSRAAVARYKPVLVTSKMLPSFRNGRSLRDYQQISLHWMVSNYMGLVDEGLQEQGYQAGVARNCILGDEVRGVRGKWWGALNILGVAHVDTSILKELHAANQRSPMMRTCFECLFVVMS